MPELSVIIPSFNAGEYLRKTITSAMAAKGDKELIVVDDGSTDQSIMSISDLDARIITKKNGGNITAMNIGVREARGDFVTFLDADDLISPEAFQHRIDYLKKHTQDKAVGSLPHSLIDENGSEIAELYEATKRTYNPPFALNLEYYRSGNFFPVWCGLYVYRREVFDLVGYFDETIRWVSDCDFHYRLLTRYAVTVIPTPSLLRRLHHHNASLRKSQGGRWSFTSALFNELKHLNQSYSVPYETIYPWENDYLT